MLHFLDKLVKFNYIFTYLPTVCTYSSYNNILVELSTRALFMYSWMLLRALSLFFWSNQPSTHCTFILHFLGRRREQKIMFGLQRSNFLLSLMFINLVHFSSSVTTSLSNNISKSGGLDSFVQQLQEDQQQQQQQHPDCDRDYCRTKELAARFEPGVDLKRVKRIATDHGFIFMGQVT